MNIRDYIVDSKDIKADSQDGRKRRRVCIMKMTKLMKIGLMTTI